MALGAEMAMKAVSMGTVKGVPLKVFANGYLDQFLPLNRLAFVVIRPASRLPDGAAQHWEVGIDMDLLRGLTRGTAWFQGGIFIQDESRAIQSLTPIDLHRLLRILHWPGRELFIDPRLNYSLGEIDPACETIALPSKGIDGLFRFCFSFRPHALPPKENTTDR
jgi:hypothetical protein